MIGGLSTLIGTLIGGMFLLFFGAAMVASLVFAVYFAWVWLTSGINAQYGIPFGRR